MYVLYCLKSYTPFAIKWQERNTGNVFRKVTVCVCVWAGNCMDRSWLTSHNYTPSGPEELQVSVDIRRDYTGHLNAVLAASWKAKDEGEGDIWHIWDHMTSAKHVIKEHSPAWYFHKLQDNVLWRKGTEWFHSHMPQTLMLLTFILC